MTFASYNSCIARAEKTYVWFVLLQMTIPCTCHFMVCIFSMHLNPWLTLYNRKLHGAQCSAPNNPKLCCHKEKNFMASR